MTKGVALPDFSLKEKTALITGASSGLGLRFAHILHAAGASVILTGRRKDRLDALAKELGSRARAVVLDVTDPQSIAALMGEAGPFDILVNNAGMNIQARAADLTVEDFDAIMNTNLRGAFMMAQAVGRMMIASDRQGRIVNIASIGAFKALPGLTAYSMSKAAIAMMTQGLAREWARAGINVNAICPGYIRTELNSDWFDTEAGKKQIQAFPRRRLGEARDLDGVLLLLCSEAGRLISGSLLTVDDGQLLS